MAYPVIQADVPATGAGQSKGGMIVDWVKRSTPS
jgi:hypothetical protein